MAEGTAAVGFAAEERVLPEARRHEPERAALALEAVSKRYAAAVALQAVDLVLPAARTTVLIGASGSGKSTVLRTLLGLVPPDSGRVLVQGTELTRANALSLRRRMGYVIQEGGLFPHLSARENVSLVALWLGWPPQRRAQRLAELVELVRLPADALDRYPAQLSGGQRQRVGLMRALMLDPPILLLDEPLAALDPIIRVELQEDLRRIFRKLAKSVVLVTHDLAEAGFFGDRLVLMNEGVVLQQGTLSELVHAPAGDYVARFVRAQRHPLEALRQTAP